MTLRYADVSIDVFEYIDAEISEIEKARGIFDGLKHRTDLEFHTSPLTVEDDQLDTVIDFLESLDIVFDTLLICVNENLKFKSKRSSLLTSFTRSLSLSSNSITRKTVVNIAEGLKGNTTLTSLDLTGNDIGADGTMSSL